MAGSIRNSYVAAYEVGESKPGAFGILRAAASIAKAVFATLTCVPMLSARADVVVLAINERRDRILSDRTSFPLAAVRCRPAFHPLGLATWWDIIVVCWTLMSTAALENDRVFALLASLIRYAWIRERLEAEGVRVLLTQRDRYADELGVIDHIRDNGGITCRFDDFPIVGYLNQNKLECDVYLAGNSVACEIFRSFPCNNKTRMFITGFPIWDCLATHFEPQVQSGAKIVTFFSQYGSDRGLFGRFGVKHYINEVLQCLPPGYVLHIRPHPLEPDDVHAEFSALGVVMLPKSEPVDIVYRRSAVCISVFSFSSYEAKHICARSFHINYDFSGVPDAMYSFFSDVLDLITSRPKLQDALRDRVATKPTADFLSAFNPGYPASCQRIQEVVATLR